MLSNLFNRLSFPMRVFSVAVLLGTGIGTAHAQVNATANMLYRIAGGATFNKPLGVTSFGSGILIADRKNHVIRNINKNDGAVSTFSGQVGVCGASNPSPATYCEPTSLAIDQKRLIAYVTDANNETVRKINLSNGAVSTLAGSAKSGGDSDGIGTSAQFRTPTGIVVDSVGNIFVSDTDNSTIRKISPVGNVETFAGKAGQCGTADGLKDAARFCGPTGMAIDSSNNLYVADSKNHSIRKISPAGKVETYVGLPGTPGFADSPKQPLFSSPTGVAIDTMGNLYVADTFNSRIRMVTPTKSVSTVVGSTIATALGALPGSIIFPGGVSVISSSNQQVQLVITTPFSNDILGANISFAQAF